MTEYPPYNGKHCTDNCQFHYSPNTDNVPEQLLTIIIIIQNITKESIMQDPNVFVFQECLLLTSSTFSTTNIELNHIEDTTKIWIARYC